MYCTVPEKPLRLFIPLIISGGIWSACGGLLSTPRVFPAGTIGDIFYETVKKKEPAINQKNGRSKSDPTVYSKLKLISYIFLYISFFVYRLVTA